MAKRPKGVRYRKDRKKWEHRKYSHGKTYSGLHQTEAEAREAYRLACEQIKRVKKIPRNALSAVMNEFLIRSKKRGRGAERLQALVRTFKRFIGPFFGEDTPMTEIGPLDVEDFVDHQMQRQKADRRGRPKNNTIDHYLQDLAALFKFYIDTYKVPISNPVAQADLSAIKNRKFVKPPFDPLTVDRAIACLDQPEDLYDKVFIVLAVCSGARRGEINRTKWTDLLLDDIERAWYRIPGTKTTESLSYIPLPRYAAELLIEWRTISDSELVLPGRSPQTKGREIMRRNAIFKKVLKRTGVKLTAKDLRDYYATMVDTMDVRILKDLMRHTSLNTTTKYSRRREELMRDAVKDLGSNFGPNQSADSYAKLPKNTFYGNQHTTRKDWITSVNSREKVGGGEWSRTTDAADMSRVGDTTDTNESDKLH